MVLLGILILYKLERLKPGSQAHISDLIARNKTVIEGNKDGTFKNLRMFFGWVWLKMATIPWH
jgi:hypothetical protein